MWALALVRAIAAVGGHRHAVCEETLMTKRLHRRAVDLLLEDATPATPGELARWTGMSDQFVRADIRAGLLKAKNVARGRRPVYLVPVDEALRYLRQMGALN